MLQTHTKEATTRKQHIKTNCFSADEVCSLTTSKSSGSSPRLPKAPQEEPQGAFSQEQVLQFREIRQQIQALQVVVSAALSKVGQQQQHLYVQQHELETWHSQLAEATGLLATGIMHDAEVSAQQLASREQHMRAELVTAMQVAVHAGQGAAESKVQLQDARQQVISLQQQLTAAAQAAAQQEKEMQDKLSTVAAEHAATMAQLSTCMCRHQHQLYVTQHELRAVRLDLELAVDHAAFSEEQLDLSKEQLYAAKQEAEAACARVADLERLSFGIHLPHS
jgi:hypothetical protein